MGNTSVSVRDVKETLTREYGGYNNRKATVNSNNEITRVRDKFDNTIKRNVVPNSKSSDTKRATEPQNINWEEKRANILKDLAKTEPQNIGDLLANGKEKLVSRADDFKLNGTEMLQKTVWQNFITESQAINPILAEINQMTETGLEMPVLSYSLDKNELIVNGDLVEFNAIKTKLIARTTETVIQGSESAAKFINSLLQGEFNSKQEQTLATLLETIETTVALDLATIDTSITDALNKIPRKLRDNLLLVIPKLQFPKIKVALNKLGLNIEKDILGIRYALSETISSLYLGDFKRITSNVDDIFIEQRKDVETGIVVLALTFWADMQFTVSKDTTAFVKLTLK